MAEKRSNRFWWTAASIALISIPLLLFLYFGGIVDGEEFSPDDFSRRSFRYNNMPFLNIDLWGIEYHDNTPEFEQTLLTDGLLGNAAPVKRWHLTYDSTSNLASRDFDAQLLTRVLDLHDEEYKSIWINWNEEHPELAAELWPIIADLARNYLYVDISKILLKATGVSADNGDGFKKYMMEAASTAFRVQADEFRIQKQYKDAVDLYSKAIKLLASEEAISGRAICYRELGVKTKNPTELEVQSEEAGE